MPNDEQQNIQNDAPNQGAQGQFHGDVNTGTQQDVSGERADGIGGDSNAPVTTGDQNRGCKNLYTKSARGVKFLCSQRYTRPRKLVPKVYSGTRGIRFASCSSHSNAEKPGVAYAQMSACPRQLHNGIYCGIVILSSIFHACFYTSLSRAHLSPAVRRKNSWKRPKAAGGILMQPLGQTRNLNSEWLGAK
jgi:hypothetical protein